MSDGKKVNQTEEQRGCTDILCCLIFTAGFVFLVIVAGMGFGNGNPVALTSVFDKSGKCCGDICDKFPEMKDYDLLYFPVPDTDYMYDINVCVKSCPSSTSDTLECYGTSDSLNANTDVCPTTSGDDYCTGDANYYQYSGTVASLKSEFCVYDTYELVNRVCFPSSSFVDSLGSYSASFSNSVNDVIDSDSIQTYVESIKHCWPIIAASVAIALVIAFVYLIYIRYCVGLVIWSTIIIFNLLFLALALLCLQKASDYEDETPPNTKDADNQKIIAYILFGCLGISIIILCCLYSKIKLAIGIMKCASNYLGDVKSALLVPPVFTLVTAAYWVLWIFGFVYLFSWGDVQQRSGSVFGEVMWADNVEGYIWFFVFMGLWINAFIQACCQFVLVSAPCMWYFANPDIENSLHAPIYTSLKRCIKHLGSLAFGAFLVALIQFIRIILYYIEQQAKKTGWGDKQPMKYILKYMQCLAACFERFIKFINRNAYIEIAIQGKNFCYSAKEAMRILWNNAGRATIINGIGGIFIFVGEFLIAMSTTVICYLILTNVDKYSEYSPFFPCIIIFIISITIGIQFMSIYGKGVDAIFLCFCHDEENARGKGMQAPEHCPELLLDFFKDRVKPKEEAQSAKMNQVVAVDAKQ